jgi:hypothetical protein
MLSAHSIDSSSIIMMASRFTVHALRQVVRSSSRSVCRAAIVNAPTQCAVGSGESSKMPRLHAIVDSCTKPRLAACMQPSSADLHRLVFALGLRDGATRPRACSPLNAVQFLVGQVHANSNIMGHSTPQHCNPGISWQHVTRKFIHS